MTARTTVHLVPHTHWDREWYRPFQDFRMRLVELVDQVLDMLDRDPTFRFTLDGQVATIDDYLEIRPEAEARIRRFVGEGRLAIGPWQILMDEFLCSGETMIRNLAWGLHRAHALGGTMPVGYLPDMFGHVAQMPQLLRRAGIEQAVVWRGVPAAIDHHRFTWVAPDGSAVAAEYLVDGYGNAADLFAIPDRAPDKLADLRAAMRAFGVEDHLLAMYGTDHAIPALDLSTLVGHLATDPAEIEVKTQTLADYIATVAPVAGPHTWSGEMRSSARANVLMGVNSARIDLKQAGGRAEIALERLAEPLQALWGDRDAWPERYVELAWRRLIENSAHDSICGCSLDEVVAQVIVRYREAEQIARGLARLTTERMAEAVPRDAILVLNPTPAQRAGLVEVDVPIPASWGDVALETGDGVRLTSQEVARSSPVIFVGEMPARDVPSLYRRIHGRELFGRYLSGYELDRVDGMRELRLEVDTEPDPVWLDVAEMKRAIDEAVKAAPDETWRVRVMAVARRTLLVEVPVPPLGLAAIRAVEGKASTDHAVVATPDGLANGRLSIRVRADGTLDLEAEDGTVLAGAGRLVDGGDRGDSYNFAPPARDRLVDTPREVSTRVLETGPLRGVIEVRRTYDWPAGLASSSDDGADDGGMPGAAGHARADAEVEVVVTTRVELRANEPFVRLALAFENRADDHRLRLHIPLPRSSTTTSAEGQFAVVDRTGDLDAGHGEVPLPTFPARSFVDAGGAAVLSTHVIEYELIDQQELAITALRATGLISRNDNAYRDDPAGPEIAIPHGQCRGAWRFEVAVMPHAGAWHDAGVLEAAERYRSALISARGASPEGGTLPSSAVGLELDGVGVVLSALRRVDGELELRLVAEHPAADEAVVRGRFTRAREVDLTGEPVGAPLSVDDGTLRLPLRPWEIRTLRLGEGG